MDVDKIKEAGHFTARSKGGENSYGLCSCCDRLAIRISQMVKF